MSTYGNNTYGESYYGTDAVFAVSVSEAGSLADTAGVQRFVNASIAETTTAADAPVGQLIANVAVIEASTFGTGGYGVDPYGQNACVVDKVEITGYTQAPLPTRPPSMPRALRIR